MSRLKFACAGGNRNPNAADWARDGTLAFGAGNNVAIWRPSPQTATSIDKGASDRNDGVDSGSHGGLSALLTGATDVVNAIRFLYLDTDGTAPSLLLSGAADGTIRIWRNLQSEGATVLKAHSKAVNCIAAAPGFDGFVSGSADGTVKIWKATCKDSRSTFEVEQTIELQPRYLPLTAALHRIEEEWILAVAGTKTTIQVYVSQSGHFTLSSTLSGHEGWVRSLSFAAETGLNDSDLLLASASQDKYVRLWRIRKGSGLPPSRAADGTLDALSGTLSLSNKAHLVHVGHAQSTYSLTFEALLLGHEDWVYTAAWRRRDGVLQLLTASADNSLAIWEAEKESGVWLSIARLGEVSAQKGATTATGSTGGFWLGLWSPDGQAVASLGRTGSWRLWSRAGEQGLWNQEVAVTGHIKEVKGLSWSPDGDYLLSTGLDQTTRLFAEWQRAGGRSSWHEFSRPQIHGYDLNCIDTISGTQFVSGADEKLLRVFNEPHTVAEQLEELCGIEKETSALMPDAANIPVLGLSNKAVGVSEGDGSLEDDPESASGAAPDQSVGAPSAVERSHPPTEDQLARHMLWPEHEKLYGHGYEISAVAASHDGSVVATACRASSIDHAVIRLYETQEWREVKPPLKAHSLTVHSLRFSADDQYLLSVGRDRQWTVFKKNAEHAALYEQIATDPKGHSRMILDCAWAHMDSTLYVFTTAGRDKIVKIWAIEDDQVELKSTLTAEGPVTAVDFLDRPVEKGLLLAYGTESGRVQCATLSQDARSVISRTDLPEDLLPSGAVTRVAWRPSSKRRSGIELAVASDDHSVRVLELP